MPNVSRLYAEHAALLRDADVLLDLLDDADPRIATTFARLTEAVDAHLDYEDGVVYPHMARHGGVLSEAAQDIAREFGALHAEWTTYRTAWPPARIDHDLAGFAAATRTILPLLAARIRLESETLYPDALQKGVLRLR